MECALRNARCGSRAWVLLNCCFGAGWMLLGCYLGAAWMLGNRLSAAGTAYVLLGCCLDARAPLKRCL
eukprot:4984572-Lingulodinium_polyedra.AAC.1